MTPSARSPGPGAGRHRGHRRIGFFLGIPIESGRGSESGPRDCEIGCLRVGVPAFPSQPQTLMDSAANGSETLPPVRPSEGGLPSVPPVTAPLASESGSETESACEARATRRSRRHGRLQPPSRPLAVRHRPAQPRLAGPHRAGARGTGGPPGPIRVAHTPLSESPIHRAFRVGHAPGPPVHSESPIHC